MPPTTPLSGRRADFPILAREVNGKRLVYLDSAATSQKPEAVLDAMDAYYREANANVHRGVYALAAEATARFESGRDALAALINAPREGVIFTKNASEAVNLVAWAWGMRTLTEGDEILVTEMEHHSNIVPWQLVAAETGARVLFAPVTDDGELDLAAMLSMIGPRTRMVGVVHASNVLGTINPVAEIAAAAHDAGALCLVDATQSVPHMPVDFSAIGADFLVLTSHKMLGPTGIGALVGKPEILDDTEPFLGGGEMISDVRTDGSEWADLPHKFEAGTPPIAEAVGFGAACSYLADVGLSTIRDHEVSLTAVALERLERVPDIQIFGPRDPERRGGAVSFCLPDVHPHDLAQLLDQEGVAVRAGHHCAKPLMRVLGVGSTARMSTHLYNDTADVEALVDAIASARRFMTG